MDIDQRVFYGEHWEVNCLENKPLEIFECFISTALIYCALIAYTIYECLFRIAAELYNT